MVNEQSWTWLDIHQRRRMKCHWAPFLVSPTLILEQCCKLLPNYWLLHHILLFCFSSFAMVHIPLIQFHPPHIFLLHIHVISAIINSIIPIKTFHSNSTLESHYLNFFVVSHRSETMATQILSYFPLITIIIVSFEKKKENAI